MKKKKHIIAVQANALNTLKVNTDTTLLLCLEAQKRGYKIFWYHVNDLSIDKNKVSAKGYFVKFFESFTFIILFASICAIKELIMKINIIWLLA